MSHHCFRCLKSVEVERQGRIGRRDSCPSCGSDLHVCKNCIHYDLKSYNECRETSADRVVDKEKSNYCDYFSFKTQTGADTPKNSQEDKKKKLDDLFK